MLVLTRKCNEAIVIGGSGGFERLVKLTVVRISGGKVRLGIEVAADVPVHRWEVWQRMSAGLLPGMSAPAGTAAARL